ncbi:DUF6732 family protein [Rubellimicrobium roseum]|uniref:Uncharacterized protein n=1 Tax=Rubellimicrobium roseum TaxID=687525 RepID=A0A5C4N8A1_9RHOB|nr:DUF6732 family protein [Rubellimicrobium roseum]TNC70350.1 hypothetical protein FHG71_13220 [Rubellimicrobium roseum]
MRNAFLLLALLLPQAALAHPGHLAERGGHDHVIAAVALLGAVIGSCWLIWTELRPAKPARLARKDDGADA